MASGEFIKEFKILTIYGYGASSRRRDAPPPTPARHTQLLRSLRRGIQRGARPFPRRLLELVLRAGTLTSAPLVREHRV